MKVFTVSWFDEAMEKHVMTVTTETRELALEVWEEEIARAELIEIQDFFDAEDAQ
jgi:hypothetical protein